MRRYGLPRNSGPRRMNRRWPWARKGESGPPPALVPSDKHVAAQVSAQRTHAATVQLVTNLEAAECESKATAAAAEEAFQNAVLDAIGEEAGRMADEHARTLAQAQQLEALLNACRELPGIERHLPSTVFIAIGDDLNTPVDQIAARGVFATPIHLDNGLTLGNVLHAEEIGPVVDLGRQWLGSFSDRMLAARDEKPGALDVSEVFGQLQHLRRQMGTGDPRSVADGVRRLRDAARLVSDEGEEPHGAFSEGRRIADGLMRRHRVGDFSRPVSIATINQRNRAFHASRDVTPRLDNSARMNWRTGDAAPQDRTAVRDAVHAANHATNTPDLIRAKNATAKAFWSSGEPPTLVADALRIAPASTTVAGINARNRAFWAGRT